MKNLYKKALCLFCSLAITLSAVSYGVFDSSAVSESEILYPTGGVEECSATVASAEVVENATFFDVPANVNAINNGTSSSGGNTYFYGKLNDAQKLLYSSLKTTADSFVASTDFSAKTYTSTDTIAVLLGTATTDNTLKAFRAMCHDNPQYYWLDSACSFSVLGNELTFFMKIDEYYYAPTARNAADTSISAKASSWYTALSALPSDYTKALTLHDMIIKEINYAYSSGTTPEDAKWAHNIDGVFSGKGAVCEGYAKTYQYMLNLLGIDNIYYVGSASSQAHAWNSVKLSGAYYLVDVTWDDLGGTAAPYGMYDYFCVPQTQFTKNHTAYTASGSASSGKWLPTTDSCSNTTDYAYYYYYKSFSDNTLTSANAAGFVSTALANGNGDYVYFIAKNSTTLGYILSALKKSSVTYYNGPFGLLYIYENIKVTSPATAINISSSPTLSVAVNSSVAVTATLTPAASDDRIIWKTDNSLVASVSGNGKTATVSGKRNGTATLTATATSGNVTATCTITVGTGVSDTADNTIWVYGTAAEKSIQLTTSLTASSYELKGKTKNGKIVWIVADKPTEIVFNEAKHTVSTKSVKTYASVSSRGKVTAKKEGTAYIYACDTGGFYVEEFIVDVKTAAKNMVFSKVAGSNATGDTLKKSLLTVGGSPLSLYIVPTSGTSPDATYQVSLANTAYSERISISEIMRDESGNMYITLEALSTLDSGKSVGAKVCVTCNESGKKAIFTATIINPISDISAVSAGGNLEKKRDSTTIAITQTKTGGDDTGGTTDKIKCVASTENITITGKTARFEKSRLVTLAFKNDVLTVTANGAITADVYIYAIATDNYSKIAKAYPIAKIEEGGAVSAL